MKFYQKSIYLVKYRSAATPPFLKKAGLFNRASSISANQTKKSGERLAKKILKGGAGQRAVVLGLSGDLGSGKTTFLQGFARGLGIKEKITSPTFVIMKKFQIHPPKISLKIWEGKHFYHIDCYRLKNAEEVLTLGFKEIINDPENIVAVEWPERVNKILPKNRMSIKFEILGKKERKITIPVLR